MQDSLSARRQMYILHCLSKTQKTHDINIFQVLSRGIRDGYHTAKVTFISDHKVDSDGLDGEWEHFFAFCCGHCDQNWRFIGDFGIKKGKVQVTSYAQKVFTVRRFSILPFWSHWLPVSHKIRSRFSGSHVLGV